MASLFDEDGKAEPGTFFGSTGTWIESLLGKPSNPPPPPKNNEYISASDRRSQHAMEFLEKLKLGNADTDSLTPAIKKEYLQIYKDKLGMDDIDFEAIHQEGLDSKAATEGTTRHWTDRWHSLQIRYDKKEKDVKKKYEGINGADPQWHIYSQEMIALDRERAEEEKAFKRW